MAKNNRHIDQKTGDRGCEQPREWTLTSNPCIRFKDGARPDKKRRQGKDPQLVGMQKSMQGPDAIRKPDGARSGARHANRQQRQNRQPATESVNANDGGVQEMGAPPRAHVML